MLIDFVFLWLFFLTAPFESDFLSIEISGFSIRPYEFFLAFLLLSMIFHKKIKLDGPINILWLYVLAGIPGLVNSISLKNSFLVLIFTFLMVLITTVIRAALSRINQLEKISLIWLLVIANIVNGFGLLQIATWILGIPISPQFHPEIHPLYRVYSVFIEPNFYGNFLAAQASALFVLWLSPSFKRWHKLILVSLAVSLFLLIMNQSRGPWLGFVGAIALYLTFRFLLRLSMPSKLVYAALIGGILIFSVVGVASIISPKQIESLALRLQNTINPLQEGAAQDRWYDIQVASSRISINPIIGNGVGNWWAHVYTHYCSGDLETCIVELGGNVRNPPRNIFVAWLFEKGLLGFVTGLSLIMVQIWVLRKILSRSDEAAKALGWAFFCASFSLFIVFQFTFSELSPFHWTNIGFLLAAYDRANLTPTSKQTSV